MNIDSVRADRGGVAAGPVTTAEIGDFMARLALASPAADDAERVDRMRALEALKAAAAAAQAHDVVAFADSQLADQTARGVPARECGVGIAAQIGLACRHSPHRASRMLATARMLIDDLPATMSALSRGETTEYRASLIVKEVGVLDAGQRRTVDAALAARLGELGDRRVEAEARRWAARLAPAAVAERAAKAHTERRVTLRPAPDTMAQLSALLPVKDGVAVFAALDAAAKSAAAQGDSRSRGQVMADTLVERVTGVSSGAHPIEISLIITDRTLLGGEDEPATVPGYGPIPADIARRWILAVLDADEGCADGADQITADHVIPLDPDTSPDHGGDERFRRRRARRHKSGQVWLRRLYTTADGRHLIGLDSHRREFPRLLRRLIEYRDQSCSTPYCDAPIRHIDHTVPVREGGGTSLRNGRGTCARCNHAKEAPGWRAIVTDPTIADAAIADAVTGDAAAKGPAARDRERVVSLITPTGYAYTSSPPRAS